MALATPGALVGRISGDLPGCNVANTRFGPIVRAKPATPPAASPRQFEIARAYRLARSWWPALTELQRDAWRTLAANTLLPNRLAIGRHLTGQQTFIRYNFQSALMGYASIDDPPDPWPFLWPTDFIPTVTAGVSAVIGPTPPQLPGGDTFIIAAARPMTTHAVNRFARWAIVGTATTTFGGTLECLALIEARFGTLQSGERIGLRIRFLDVAQPLLSWIEHPVSVI